MRQIHFLTVLALGSALATGQDKPAKSAAQKTSPTPVAAKSAPLPSATEIRGVVLAPDGRPASRAHIVIAAIDGPSKVSAPALQICDEKGGFVFDGKGAAEWTLRAHASPFAVSAESRVKAGQSVTLVLEAGNTISGTVTAADSGDVVPAAEVEASEWETSPYAALDPDFGMARARTDAKGRFTLSGVTLVSRAFVRATARGYATGVVKGPLGGPLRFRLIPGRDLAGTVIDATGKPVSRALLLFQPMSFAGTTPITSLSQASGRFEARGLRNGPYDLTVTAQGFAALTRSVILPTTSMTITLERPSTVTGRLVDEEGHGIKGTVRWQSHNGVRTPQSMERSATVEAAADGRFSLAQVRTGTAGLRLTAPGYPSVERTVEISRAGETVNLGEVGFEPGLQLRGRVVDSNDAPVSGAKLQAFVTLQTDALNPASAETAADGRFTLRGLEDKAYHVVVTAPGFAMLQAALTPSADEQRLVLRRATKVTGRIVDPGGNPVAEAFATIQKGDDRRTARSTRTGEDGQFMIEAPESGEAKLSVTAAGFEIFSRAVQLEPDANLGDFTLSRGLRIRGIVVDARGQPIAGAAVENQTVRSYLTGSSVETDDAGAFEIRGISPGRVRLVATHRRYSPAQVFVDVTPDAGDPEPVEITLTRGARVEGVVRRRDGSPVSQALVQAMMFSRSAPPPSGEPHGTLTAADGTFSFDALYPDRVLIALMSGRNGSYSSVASADVLLVEGETTPITLTLRSTVVSGVVRRGGAPAPGLHVSVTGSTSAMMGNSDSFASLVSDIPWNTAVSGADGRFAIRVVGPLDGSISLRDSDMSDTLYSKRLEVPDADAFQTDIDFGGARVSGRLVDQATQSGVPEARITVSLPPETDNRPGRIVQGVRSDAAGQFTLDLEPGVYQLVATADGFQSLKQPLDVQAGEMAMGDLALERGGTLHGRLILPSGRPAPGVSVRGLAGAFFQTATSGADGEFSLSGLGAKGGTIVAVDGVEHVAVYRFDSLPTETVEIPMALAARVTVTLGGDPAALGRVTVSASTIDGEFVGGFAAQANGQGVATLNLPPGVIVLTASSKTHSGSITLQTNPGVPATAAIEMKPLTQGPGKER